MCLKPLNRHELQLIAGKLSTTRAVDPVTRAVDEFTTSLPELDPIIRAEGSSVERNCPSLEP